MSVKCLVCARTFLSQSGMLSHWRARHSARAKQLDAIRGVETDRRFILKKVVPKVKKLSVPIPPALRLFAEKHGLVCTWCEHPVRLDVPLVHPASPTREHLVSRAAGGRGGDNLVLAHRWCNELRGNIEASAYRRLLRGEALTFDEMWPHRKRFYYLQSSEDVTQ